VVANRAFRGAHIVVDRLRDADKGDVALLLAAVKTRV
jgi:hypothetical protein